MTYMTTQRKNSFFLITIIVAATLISIPIISNHFFHPEHYFHIAIHEAGFVLAVFLIGITIISYRKSKLPRMLFSCAAFTTLAATQLSYMVAKINVPHMMNMGGETQEYFDLGILIMTAIFAAGIFYRRH